MGTEISEKVKIDWTKTLIEVLRAEAAALMKRERRGHILQPTALIGEAWKKLRRSDADGWDSKTHFRCAAVNAMRQVLIEYARKPSNSPIGGGMPVPLTILIDPAAAKQRTVPSDDFESGLRKVERLRGNRCAQVATLYFLGGLTVASISEWVGVSTTQARRDLREGRIILWGHLGFDEETPRPS